MERRIVDHRKHPIARHILAHEVQETAGSIDRLAERGLSAFAVIVDELPESDKRAVVIQRRKLRFMLEDSQQIAALAVSDSVRNDDVSDQPRVIIGKEKEERRLR